MHIKIYHVYMIKASLIILLITCFISCETPYNDIPIRDVNFTVSIDASRLIHTGGYEYFTGGVSGIVIYRFDINTFYAYDRACPYDWEDGGRVSVVDLVLYDSLCGSSFNILNGYPYSGSKSEHPLRPYKTQLINDYTLHVYN